MSQTIDSRVVEMKFDNKNFEKNVAESMKTLENLDKRLTKLENTDVHLDKVGKAADSFDLSKLDKSLDAITHRFSVMGQVGASVIQNLTTDAYNLVKTFSSSIWNTTFGQIKSGGKNRAMNIAEAQFRIEGLGLNYDDYYDSIDKAVSGTAYGFDEAAVAASQFASSSVQAGEDMDHALRSISGMAAMTGRSYSDLASVMEDAAAAGKVTNDTFGRLSERGLAALQEYAKRTNQTVEDVRKAAKDGEIAFVEFARVMDEAYGEHATKADETFTGVTSNIRAQLSRIGQTFYSPLIENNSDLIKMFQSVKKQIKALKEYTDPFAKTMADYVLKLSRWGKDVIDGIDVSKFEPVFQNATKIFNNLTVAAENLYSNVLKPFGKQFKAAFYEVFPSLNTGKGLLVTLSDKLVEASEGFRKFTSEIGLFGEKGASVKDTLIGIFEIIKMGVKILKTAATVLESVIKVVVGLLSNLDISGAFRAGTGFLTEAIEVGSYLIGGIVMGLSSGIPTVIEALGNVCKAIIEAFCSFFGIASPSKVMADLAYWLVAGIADGLKAGLKAGLITGAIMLVFGLILSQFKEGEENVLQTLSRLFDSAIDKIAGTITRLSDWLGSTSFGKAFTATFDAIAAIMKKVASVVQTFNIDKFKQIFGTFKQFVMLGGYIYILVQFAAASTMFSTAIYNISRAAKVYMDSMVLKYFGATLKNLAIAIAVITGSILMFTGIIESDKGTSLYKAVGIIAGIITALVVAVKMLQGAIKSEKLDKHGIIKVEAMFVGLAAAVYMIATAIRKVGRLDLPQLIIGASVIGGFLVAMAGLVMLMEYVESKLPEKGGYDQNVWIPILAIAASVRLVAGAIKKIAVIPVEDFWRASIVIGGLTGIMGLIGVLITGISKLNVGPFSGSGNMLGLAATMVSLALVIRAISKAIIWLSYVPEDKIEQGKSVVFKIMGWLAALMVVSSIATKVLGGILAGFAATVAALAGAIWLLGQMESGLAQGIESVIGIMALIAAYIGAVNLINKATGGGDATNGTKALLYVAACIAAMGAVVYACGQLEWGQIGRGLVVVGALTMLAATLGILFGLGDQVKGGESSPIKQGFWEKLKSKASQSSGIIKTIATIKAVVSALVKVALVALVFAKTIKSPDEIKNSMKMLAGVVIALAAVLAVAGVVAQKAPNMEKMTKPIAALAGAILVIAGSLYILGAMEEPGTVITSMMAIGAILLAMGYVLEKSKVFGVQGMNTKGILAASVAIIAISAGITLMYAAIGEMSWNKLGTIATIIVGISAVLFAIAGAMKIVDKVQISLKSVGAFLLATLSLVAIAATIALFATYVEDMKKAGEAAGMMAGVFATMGITLKVAESVSWKAAASILVGTLSFVAIARAIVVLANYTEDMARARDAAIMMGALLLEMGVVLGVLTAISMGTGGTAAAVILAIAGALAIMGLAMIEMAGGVYIGVAALEKLIGVLTPENAQQVVSFFETIGDGIGTAGQHIADGIQTAATAIHDAVAAIKQETDSAGFDIAHGLATGLTKYAPLVAIAGAALGAMAIFGLRSKDGVDAHSDSVKSVEAGYDVAHGLGSGMIDNADQAVNPAKSLGALVINALTGTLSEGMESADFKGFWERFKGSFSNIKVNDVAKAVNPLTGGISTFLLKTGFKGTFQSYGEDAVNSVKEGATQAASEGGGMGDFFSSLFSGFTSGNFDNVLSGFDFSSILGENGIGGLKSYLDEAGVSMDILSGDNIPKLIEKLKEGGLAGDALIAALKELGLTEEQLQDLGLAEKLGIEEAKDGIKDTEEALKSLADEIISGKFGNAPERWDKMFEHLVQSGKTAEEAYAAIADAQNEVNKRLGSSVVHTADEMSKKVSESVRKANQAQADANAQNKGEKKAVKYGTKEYDEAMAKNGQTINTTPTKEKVVPGKATGAVDLSKLNNEKAVTAEKEKQVSLAEKEAAVAALNANKIKADNTALTDEKRKQIDAENAQYQKVVDTYNKQQEMVKAIQDQEAATKKAEEAEKKRGDAIKASAGAVVYGSDEYYKQTGKTGMTINTMPTRKVEKTEPVQAETKVEVTPQFEIKKVDTTKLKSDVITKVETEFKDLQAKATITPKIDTAQAEAAISSLKTKTQDLKTTIPQTFSGIAAEVGKHLSTIASKITQEGGKIATNTKTVFQNAVSAAVTILNGNETITKFTNAGKAAGQGYANGIRAKVSDVRAAGAALGNTAIKATKTVTKTNSPSKIFTQLGEWNGIGYGNGMLDSIGYVTNASSQMANSSLDEVYRVVSAVENAVSNGLDVAPTVTPVIDTSQIQNGIANMRSVMDMTNVDAAAITANMSAKASYDDSQVEEMRARMSEMRGAFDDLIDVINNQPTPEVNANVILEGDANGVFKLVRNQDSIYTKMHGKSAFA